MSKPSPTQLAVLRYMMREKIHYVDWYNGEVGTEWRGSGFFFNAHPKPDTPKLTRGTVRGLIKNGYLEHKDGAAKITDKGKAAGLVI